MAARIAVNQSKASAFTGPNVFGDVRDLPKLKQELHQIWADYEQKGRLTLALR
jgi:hypothetical protein